MMTLDDAIRQAKENGMVPFYAVIPVSPELMRDVAQADQFVGKIAMDEFATQVRKWIDDDKRLRVVED